MLLVFQSVCAQHQIIIDASLDTEKGTISISQEIVYENSSNTSINEIYLNDWPNSFSSKTTPLARRFGENYNSSFHFEKEEDRGRTEIFSVLTKASDSLTWERVEAADIIRVSLENLITGRIILP